MKPYYSCHMFCTCVFVCVTFRRLYQIRDWQRKHAKNDPFSHCLSLSTYIISFILPWSYVSNHLSKGSLCLKTNVFLSSILQYFSILQYSFIVLWEKFMTKSHYGYISAILTKTFLMCLLACLSLSCWQNPLLTCHCRSSSQRLLRRPDDKILHGLCGWSLCLPA